ncbi:type II toxin-antitoxin system Phd/YefM family antitoxin [Solitalea canadensis]|uniref:Antitoxin n=1 Tax=Solitalea canadensis (strain ATCC 29591 / DSM 3403 / JCM 21819 / LMG 8368 / NBRC 15130 / NCIMB 12057 / USAM 9D) TaxID=929556 RepID=H8KLQ9_SOLCM|nr:type II toxin-antitoxin system Phd/YefM family antitoxin [Solitalea canadensis]AFD09213.1 antitoxin of toxin-antitoxin stability system [Solitalea canadensis DSM 3403]
MKVINYSDLRENLKSNLDYALEDEVTVKRPKGKGNVVILSEENYTSIMETLHLVSTEANRKHLIESIKQVEEGKVTSISVDDLWK